MTIVDDYTMTSAGDSRLESTNLTTNPSVFRYWQRITTAVRDVLRYRTPVGSYLATGFLEEAFQRGFDIVDSEGAQIELEYDMDLFAEMLDKYIRARGAAYFHGWAILVYIKFMGNKNPVLHWVEPQNVTEITIEPGTKNITKLVFTPPVLGTDMPITTPITLTRAQLAKTRLIGNYSAKMGQFRAEVDPIIDDLIGLASNNQQTALRVIRIGSGQRYMIAPASMVQDTETNTKLKNFLANFGMNSLFITPEGSFGAEGESRFEYGIKFAEGSLPSDPKMDRDIHLEAISSYTKIPREIFIGSELGLRSAETNRSSFMNKIELTQKKANPDILWMLSLLVELDETTDLRWNPFEEIDESEAFLLKQQKLDLVSRLLPNLEALGMDQKQLYEYIDLELDIDETMKEEAKAEKEAMREEIMGMGGEPEEEEEGEEEDE